MTTWSTIGLLCSGLSYGPWLDVGAAHARGDGGMAAAHAPAAEQTAAAGHLEVRVDSMTSDAEATRGWIEDRAAKVFEALERPLDEGSMIRIHVRGGVFDYRIMVVLLRNGSALATEHQPSEIECACGSEEMLEQVAAAVEAAERTLGEAAERERKEAAARAEAERRHREEPSRSEAEQAGGKQRARYRPSVLGRAGIGVLGAGAIATLGGIIMATRSPQHVATLGYMERDWLAPGAAFVGIGTSMVATGVTLVIVDAVRCRRDRSRCGARGDVGSTHGAAWAAGRRGGGQ